MLWKNLLKRVDRESILSYFILLVVVTASFIFLVTISPYPAGDDPGFHASILKYIIKYEGVDFKIPFFPSLQMSNGSERFVTSTFLAAFSKISGLSNVFPLIIYFAAFCSSFALVFIYLLIDRLIGSKAVALISIIILSFSKWYQEPFWEGSYDQYTGLLFLSAFIYLFFVWYKTTQWRYLCLSSLLLITLYKAHQLGFLIALILFVVIFFYKIRTKLKPFLFYSLLLGVLILFITYYIIAQPGYFAINAMGHYIPQLLSAKEGISGFIYLLITLGFFVFLFFKKNFFVFAWLAVAFIFSQSFLLDLPFYPFRFNIYLMQVMIVLLAFALDCLFAIIKKIKNSKLLIPLFLLSFLIALIFQINYLRALAIWITDQNKDNNPSSVILREDIRAFKWLKNNSELQDVVLAPYKWGYYLPAIAERAVVLDDAIGGDARDNRWELAEKAKQIYTADSSRVAYQLAKEIGVNYIFWDASIARFPNRYSGYDLTKFKDLKFLKVYDQDNAKIFKVQ